MNFLYWIVVVVVVIWNGFDANKRGASLVWPVGTLILLPVFLPVYFAFRPLLPGETRDGGRGWNVLKNLALSWTALMVYGGMAGFFAAASQNAGKVQTGTEAAASAIGTGIGMGLIVMVWLIPMICMLVLGFFLKKSVVEEG